METENKKLVPSAEAAELAEAALDKVNGGAAQTGDGLSAEFYESDTSDLPAKSPMLRRSKR